MKRSKLLSRVPVWSGRHAFDVSLHVLTTKAPSSIEGSISIQSVSLRCKRGRERSQFSLLPCYLSACNSAHPENTCAAWRRTVNSTRGAIKPAQRVPAPCASVSTTAPGCTASRRGSVGRWGSRAFMVGCVCHAGRCSYQLRSFMRVCIDRPSFFGRPLTSPLNFLNRRLGE